MTSERTADAVRDLALNLRLMAEHGPEIVCSDVAMRSWADTLDRLVARNQQLQEALESGARYAEGVMLREADPFLRGIHQENLDKISAALASVRARTQA